MSSTFGSATLIPIMAAKIGAGASGSKSIRTVSQRRQRARAVSRQVVFHSLVICMRDVISATVVTLSCTRYAFESA